MVADTLFTEEAKLMVEIEKAWMLSKCVFRQGYSVCLIKHANRANRIGLIPEMDDDVM